MPVRRSISFRKLMRKISKSTEDLSSVGHYRSVENLSYEFNEADEDHVAQVEHEDDAFRVDVEMPGPTEQELIEVYEKYRLMRDSGECEKEVEGWITLKSETKEFDENKKKQQYNTLVAILEEKGIKKS